MSPYKDLLCSFKNIVTKHLRVLANVKNQISRDSCMTYCHDRIGPFVTRHTKNKPLKRVERFIRAGQRLDSKKQTAVQELRSSFSDDPGGGSAL
jgi:hypothetical protein